MRTDAEANIQTLETSFQTALQELVSLLPQLDPAQELHLQPIRELRTLELLGDKSDSLEQRIKLDQQQRALIFSNLQKINPQLAKALKLILLLTTTAAQIAKIKNPEFAADELLLEMARLLKSDSNRGYLLKSESRKLAPINIMIYELLYPLCSGSTPAQEMLATISTFGVIAVAQQELVTEQLQASLNISPEEWSRIDLNDAEGLAKHIAEIRNTLRKMNLRQVREITNLVRLVLPKMGVSPNPEQVLFKIVSKLASDAAQLLLNIDYLTREYATEIEVSEGFIQRKDKIYENFQDALISLLYSDNQKQQNFILYLIYLLTNIGKDKDPQASIELADIYSNARLLISLEADMKSNHRETMSYFLAAAADLGNLNYHSLRLKSLTGQFAALQQAEKSDEQLEKYQGKLEKARERSELAFDGLSDLVDMVAKDVLEDLKKNKKILDDILSKLTLKSKSLQKKRESLESILKTKTPDSSEAKKIAEQLSDTKNQQDKVANASIIIARLVQLVINENVKKTIPSAIERLSGNRRYFDMRDRLKEIPQELVTLTTTGENFIGREIRRKMQKLRKEKAALESVRVDLTRSNPELMRRAEFLDADKKIVQLIETTDDQISSYSIQFLLDKYPDYLAEKYFTELMRFEKSKTVINIQKHLGPQLRQLFSNKASGFILRVLRCAHEKKDSPRAQEFLLSAPLQAFLRERCASLPRYLQPTITAPAIQGKKRNTIGLFLSSPEGDESRTGTELAGVPRAGKAP